MRHIVRVGTVIAAPISDHVGIVIAKDRKYFWIFWTDLGPFQYNRQTVYELSKNGILCE